MGIMLQILCLALSLLIIGLDVCLFFLLIRLVLTWRSNYWLERLNDAGKRLVHGSFDQPVTLVLL